MKSLANSRDLDRLVHRLGGLGPSTPRRWGTLPPHEMLCHLADASASILDRPGGTAGRPRRLTKWLALYTALPWPRGLRTPASVDPRQGGSRPDSFDRDRERAVAGLRGLAVAGDGALPAGHGRFGAMGARDWHRWGWRHTDHHLRQFGL
ncbi:MAG TPA: hypothetical protein VMN37_09405 [Gemmatimonadales bacterium]|nr:hypothetical protein [Gemmatimonadales bacterium]